MARGDVADPDEVGGVVRIPIARAAVDEVHRLLDAVGEFIDGGETKFARTMAAGADLANPFGDALELTGVAAHVVQVGGIGRQDGLEIIEAAFERPLAVRAGDVLHAHADGFEAGSVAIGRPVRVVTENKTDDFAFFWAQPAEEKSS